MPIATTATTTACDTCATCDHSRYGHSVSGCVLRRCRCALFIDPDSPRAELRAVARDMGWRLREQELLDDFCRDGVYVTVIYSAYDHVMGVNTPAAYTTGATGAGRQVALEALLADA